MYSGENFSLAQTNGSGILFHNAGAGTSIPVGSFNNTSWLGAADGSSVVQQIDNNKYINPSGVSVNGASTILLKSLPNYLCTLNARFTHSTPVEVQNCHFYIGDRTTYNNNPSGIIAYGYEAVHPNTVQVPDGSGASNWTQLSGSGSFLTLTNSPSTSGLFPGSGPSVTHDFYLALSVSPQTVGAKLFSGYLTLEYL